ncbi:hypothetical protein FQN54_009905 [Arachnomyces sp. PD_36]|nr:hypothetical protein FQN54_009905 [Arachnomyces sp. PD_36]
MPRTLPWLVGAAAKADPPKGSRGRKRAQEEESDVHDHDDGFSTPKRKVGQGHFRSSSMSPVAREPPVEEYMREGLDGDDIYVMVEDEFQAVAQSFTQHLHYAEYVRRTRQARIDNATKIDEVARRTDPKTAMRAETRKKKDAETLAERHRLGLEKMKGPALERRPAVDSEEEDTRIEEDEEDDPWLGTSLQGLMTKSIKSQSLVGLQGIQSATRAAAGYSKSSGSNTIQSPSTGARNQPHVIDGDVTASGEDDDLDAEPSREPAQRKPATPRRDPPLPLRHMDSRESSHSRSEQSRTSTPRGTMEPPSRTSTSTGFRDRSATPKARYRPRMSLPFDEFDDVGPSREEKPAPRRHSSYSGKIKKEDPRDDEKRKKSRLNEVPIFLT